MRVSTKKISSKVAKKEQVLSLEELLLKGPVMSASQYKGFQKRRKELSAWRGKSSV